MHIVEIINFSSSIAATIKKIISAPAFLAKSIWIESIIKSLQRIGASMALRTFSKSEKSPLKKRLSVNTEHALHHILYKHLFVLLDLHLD